MKAVINCDYWPKRNLNKQETKDSVLRKPKEGWWDHVRSVRRNTEKEDNGLGISKYIMCGEEIYTKNLIEWV